MAPSKGQSTVPPRDDPTVTPERGIELLSEQISKAQELVAFASPKSGIEEDDFGRWKNTTRNYVEMAFGANHRNVRDFEGVRAYVPKSTYAWIDPHAETLRRMITWLNGYIDQLRAMGEIRQQRNPAPLSAASETSKKVFIVHGHNDALKYELAHSLQRAGVDVTILHDELNRGRTLLEKFADHGAEAGFAVVLLSADDLGRAKNAPSDSLQPRARQNVVFELGFFVGFLGRARVCAVYEAGVEEPSDLQGLAKVQHVPAGRWKHEVAKEINGAGIELDFSKL
jgi:predicted nucleotide-binding protein